jgi:hypothetical protein
MLQMHIDKVKRSSSKHNLPLLKCECVHEILLLPELKTLGKAIEEYAMEHQKKYALTQEEADVLQDNLIAQAFKMASEIEPSPADIQVRLSPKNQKRKRFPEIESVKLKEKKLRPLVGCPKKELCNLYRHEAETCRNGPHQYCGKYRFGN